MKNLILSRKPNQTVELFEGGKRIGSVKVIRFKATRFGWRSAPPSRSKILRGELEQRDASGGDAA